MRYGDRLPTEATAPDFGGSTLKPLASTLLWERIRYLYGCANHLVVN